MIRSNLLPFLPLFRDSLIRSHPALVNAIILILHSVTSSIPGPSSASSSRNVPASSYSEMPGGYMHSGKGPSILPPLGGCFIKDLLFFDLDLLKFPFF